MAPSTIVKEIYVYAAEITDFSCNENWVSTAVVGIGAQDMLDKGLDLFIMRDFI